MKKHLSVLALCARNNLCKILALLPVMAAAEVLLVMIQWNQLQDSPYIIFEELLQWVPAASYLSLLLLVFLLCRSGDHAHSTGYTLQRLRIREGTAVLWKAVYNSICLLLFWAVQAAVMLALGCWYLSVIDVQCITPQTIFLAFYRSEFLHNLLPLDHWSRYVGIGTLLLSLGFSTALTGCKLRRGNRFGWGMPIFLCAVLAGYFRQGIADWRVDAFIVMLVLVAAGVEAGCHADGRIEDEE